MATITRTDHVQRFLVVGDPTSGIPAVCNPGDRIYRQDTATEYVMTQAGVVAEASLDASPSFTSATVTDSVIVSGSAASPVGTVRYVGGAEGGTSSVAINAVTGGAITLRVAGTAYCRVSATDIQIGSAGAAFAISGKAATGTNTASGAITLNANTGTGTGAVGGYVFKVPVTTGSGTGAQTLTTVLTLDATTAVRASFAGALGINGAATSTSKLNITGLPTSSAGLASGDVWSDSGTLKIVA